MAQRQIILKRPRFSQNRTLPLRIHSEADGLKNIYLLSPIKLKTQNSKHIKASTNHLPVAKETSVNIQQKWKRVKQLFNQKKFDEVIPYLKQLLNTSKEIQSLYYLGCSFLYRQKYQHSIYNFNLLIEKQPTYNRNSYIMLAIAYKELNLFKAAIKILYKCLEIHKHFEEAIIYLSKLYMKINQYTKALSILESNIKRNPSLIFQLTYADCLRLNNKLSQSIYQYNIICQDQGLRLIGLFKRMTALYQLKQYQQSINDCNKLINNLVQSSEVYYFKGINLLNLRPNRQFPVEFSKALDLNNHQQAVTKSFCEIIKNQIVNKDMYAAEVEIKRSEYLNICKEEIMSLLLFVEGAIDCVKKRSSDAISKLLQVQKSLKTKNFVYSGVLQQNINIYLGYAYFLSSEYTKTIKYYQMQTSLTPSSQYNKLICEAIIYHQQNDFSKCYSRMTLAKTFLPRFQPYFYLGINYIQQYFINNQNKFLQKSIEELHNGLEFNPPSPYYFYLSLVMIQAKKPAHQMISLAIEKSDDNIADYYFVRGIIESSNDLSLALNDFTSAIQMLKIPAYYKERSKCFYQLGMYSSAIEDLLKVLSSEKDYQTNILLCFNYYANEEYQLSLRTLQQTTTTEENQYLLGLKICLNIHMKNYKKAGTLGEIIYSMETNTKITDQRIFDKFAAILEEKYSIGEFDIVELLCLGGTYHFVHGDYKKSQTCFYDALSELKHQLTKDSNIDFGTEAKIYQSKFNISLAHLMMKEYQYSKNLLDTLMEETESQSTVKELQKLIEFINQETDNNISMGVSHNEVTVDIFPNYKLLSENFPVVKVRLKNAVLVIKPILFFPQKLKFNIFPEMNPRFLKEFGIWKVQNTPQPPWVIRQGNYFKFTNTLDLESPTIEYTETNHEPQSQIEMSQRNDDDKLPEITKEQLKLPDKVSERLQRIIHQAKQ